MNHYKEALQNIVDPIGYLRKEAEKDGEQLNGIYAIQLSNSASFLQKIAQMALNTPSVEPVGYEAEAAWNQHCTEYTDVKDGNGNDYPPIQLMEKEDFISFFNHLLARQMSVPTNDQRGIMNELIELLKVYLVNFGNNVPMIKILTAVIEKATELLSQQKEMDGKVAREEADAESLAIWRNRAEYFMEECNKLKAAPIDPLKAREIAEKAFDAGNDFYTMDEYQETKQQYLDTHYPIEKEGDDKADNQE